MVTKHSKLTLTVLAVVATVAAAVLCGVTARTGRAAIACAGQTTVQPFTPWGDNASYTMLPNGSFESMDGWSHSGGATQVSGNEPYHVNDPADSYSLSLPTGASAVSPSICFTLFHPDLRFFAVNTGSAKSTLQVEAITNILGLRVTTPVATLASGSSWQPTPILPFLTNLLAPISAGLQFRFTAQGNGGAWQIDDAYLDPIKNQ
jgi:hypothetical protein